MGVGHDTLWAHLLWELDRAAFGHCGYLGDFDSYMTFCPQVDSSFDLNHELEPKFLNVEHLPPLPPEQWHPMVHGPVCQT